MRGSGRWTGTIDDLCVGHWPHPVGGAAPTEAGLFVLDTCLRRCVIGTGESATARTLALGPPELLHGPDAYRLLLEIACGLRSAVAGETNVLGQMRRAWRAQEQQDAALQTLVMRLFADARDIRAEHLHGIGGASYGSLVRRLLRPAPGERVLFVGAGALARSILPMFAHCRLSLWNRSTPQAVLPPGVRVFAPGEGDQAAAWAAQVIMTTPADETNDQRWAGWLAHGSAYVLIHLGHRHASQTTWPAPLRVHDLEDLFALRRSQNNVRSLQIERARLACRQRVRQLVDAGTASSDRQCAAG